MLNWWHHTEPCSLIDFRLSEGTEETRLLHSLTCFKKRQGIRLVKSNVLVCAPQSWPWPWPWPWTPPITPLTLHRTLLTTAPLSIDAQQRPPLTPPFAHPDGPLMNPLTSTSHWSHCTPVCGTPKEGSPNHPQYTHDVIGHRVHDVTFARHVV